MKLNKTLRSAISVALACALMVTTLTPTAIFAQTEAPEAAPQQEAVAQEDVEATVSEQGEEDEAVELDLEALPPVDLNDYVVSYRAYTDTFANVGQKLSYVIIEYADTVYAPTVTTGTYGIVAYEGDNNTWSIADVTAVYTNSKADIREDKASVTGKYVIVEIDPYDGVGTMDLSNIFIKDENGKQILDQEGKPLTTNGYGNIAAVNPLVYQVKDVALNGNRNKVMVKAKSDTPIDRAKALETLNFNYDAFQDLVLDSASNNYGDGKIRVKYHVPDAYDESKEYPLVVVQCGGGLRMREIFDPNDPTKLLYRSFGANIAFDTSVTSWMSPDYKYEDVIVLSVDNRNMADSELLGGRYVAADDINQVVEYFIDNFAVDPDRVYYSGNSQGSLIGYQTVSARPDLWAAFMPCNGLALTSPDPFSSDENMAKFMEGVAKVMDPITANHVAVYWNLGETDTGASGARGKLFYDYAKAKYEAEGLSQDEIDSLLRLNVFADEEYLQYRITNADGSAYAHGATKLAYTAHKDEFMPWLLSQSKARFGRKQFAEDVESIQAFTDGTVYGAAVVEIVVTFKPGVDLSGLTAEDFYVEDRGSLNPDFGQVKIESIKVDGNKVTLYVDDDTQATAKNRLVYGGNNEDEAAIKGSRERNAFGIYCTGAWYRDENGTIFYGRDDTDEYENNTSGMGYQVRHSLELKIRYADDFGFTPEECLADDLGEYNADGLWLPTVDREFGEGRFQNLYDLKIPSTAANTEETPITDGTDDPYVRGFYYVPENYDPANGIVFYLQGQGISYWKLADGCDNEGCGFYYDTNTYSWMNKGAIAINIQDRSNAGKGQYSQYYDYVKDDVNVMKYFIDQYGVTGNIVIQGNSRGTNASSMVIKALTGQPYRPNGSNSRPFETLDKKVYNFDIDTFLCQNGTFGGNNYNADDWAAIAATGMKVWCFDGEQDANNITNIARYTEVLKSLGYDDAWIDENVRITGLSSEMFAYWGESDHSVTRINSWYFADDVYYGPGYEIEDGKLVYYRPLKDGDTYQLALRGSARTSNKNGYNYKVYDDLFQVWALQSAGTKSIADDVVSVQAYTDGTIYGTGLVKVVVTFKNGVDVSGLTAEDFVIEDRGSLNPDFGQVKIKSISKSRQVVTLIIDANATAATEKNSLVYTGSGEHGSRERNAFGIYPTGNWYRDPEGVIRFGDGEQGYEANTNNLGYWIRPSLELKIRYADENGYRSTECLADSKGQYNANSVWLPTVDQEFASGKFYNLYDLQIPSTAATAADGSKDEFVQGYYYVPENYDPANGIVFYIQGNAISFWKIDDGTNNAGCGFMYDVNTYSWRNKGCIAVNIQDRSNYAKGAYRDVYDYVTDDVNVMKYFIDGFGVTGNIVIQGNSRGTNASSTIIKALAGRPYTKLGESVTLDKEVYDFTIDAYICQNGTFGGNNYNAEDWAAIAETGLKVWCFDGEQDANNITNVANYTAALKELGCPDEWIAENVRITGLSSEMFAFWGESDHSVTRINPWYFADAAYYGPDYYVDDDGKLVYNTKLADGDTYTLECRGSAATSNKVGYEYKVYDDLFQVWALRNTYDEAFGFKVCALTRPGHFGQKLKAVIIEFPQDVDGSKLSVDSFVVRDLGNNLTGAYREAQIEKVYVSATPEVNNGKFNAVNRGRYVIIETNDFNKIGLVADNYYYYDANGASKSIAYRKDLAGVYYLDVRAVKDIYAADGTVALSAQDVPTVIDQKAIKHDYLDEFQYVYLNDEEADAVLAKFTFKNNNSPYSLSSNSRNSDHSTLKPEELLGDLNYATLAGLGVRIWYQLPENYDPNKTYPMFLFAHGTGESFTSATAGDGTVYTNHGGHFNIGYPAGAWTMTEEYGYQDCIVVAPQYYNGNSPRADGYERDDAFRVAMCWAFDNLAVDRDHVYVSGTSQGAGRTTALVRDCAEYITGAIVQNGGYSSAISRRTTTNAAGQTPVEEHEMIFKFATDENVAFWFFQGVNDRTSPPITSETMYTALVNNYKAAGKSDEWIADHVRYTYLNDKIYLDMNETSFHSSMKPTYNWYAYYRDAEYNAQYSDAEDSLGAYFDTKYGKNDPNGYKGLIDWALHQNASELDSNTAVVEFVKRMYREFLGREADPTGLNDWTTKLLDGSATLAQLVRGFVLSPEFTANPLDNTGFVTAMYRIVFDRDPDISGLASWTQVLDNGCTRKKVLEGFLNSEELKALAGRLGVTAGSYKSNELLDRYPSVTAFVSRLYGLVLGRTASKAELESWVSVLVSGDNTASQVVTGFFKSRELANRGFYATDMVRLMYRAILNREPDNTGYSAWVAVYEQKGMEKVLDGFLNSVEFRGLCEQYGVRP